MMPSHHHQHQHQTCFDPVMAHTAYPSYQNLYVDQTYRGEPQPSKDELLNLSFSSWRNFKRSLQLCLGSALFMGITMFICGAALLSLSLILARRSSLSFFPSPSSSSSPTSNPTSDSTRQGIEQWASFFDDATDRISHPIVYGTCTSFTWTQRLISAAVNIFGTLVMFMSSYIQEMCTSPCLLDIQRSLQSGGDIRFGSNTPSTMFANKNKGAMIASWTVMVLTSLPLHLMLNAMFTVAYEYTSITDSGFPIDATGTCKLVVHLWVTIAVASMLLLKGIVVMVMVFGTDGFKYRKYDTLGDLICLATKTPRLAIHGESMLDRNSRSLAKDNRLKNQKGNKTDSNIIVESRSGIQPRARKVLFKYFSKSEYIDLVSTLLAATSLIVSVAAPYSAPSARSLPRSFLVILIINIPHLAMSYLYFLYSDILTRILLELEWRSFAKREKMPRVSLHSGMSARRTRFFGMKLWIGVCMILYSIIIHFAISQVQELIEVYTPSLPLPSTLSSPGVNLPGVNLPGAKAGQTIIGYTNGWAAARFLTLLYILSILPIPILGGIYAWPMKSYMPVMLGSVRVVLAACSWISGIGMIPERGVRWGDLGAVSSHCPCVGCGGCVCRCRVPWTMGMGVDGTMGGTKGGTMGGTMRERRKAGFGVGVGEIDGDAYYE